MENEPKKKKVWLATVITTILPFLPYVDAISEILSWFSN
jgi:hypothetical protein